MKLSIRFQFLVIFILMIMLSVGVTGSEYDGVVKVGFVYVDDEGNRGVNQSTYNLYEGAALSLEKFSYRFDDGTRVFGNFRNITLNNRNLVLGVTKSGLYGLTMRNNQYRRTYSFQGSRFTRRHQTNGQFWVQPHRHLKLFGGYGQTGKKGQMVDLFEPAGNTALTTVDYTQKYFNAGARLKYKRSVAELEYRGSDYSDDTNDANDRSSKRFKLTVATPLPKHENLLVNGGFQRFESEIPNQIDTLTANTVWGGLKFFYGDGYSLRYSFIFDRSRRTGDLSATDNISHAVYGSKLWRGHGGFSVGYRYKINDDVRDEVTTNGYFFSGWVDVVPEVILKAGFGSEKKEVQKGRTLTGDEDFTRYWASAKYRFTLGFVRVKLANKKTENDDIGSSAEFTRVATDLSLFSENYGQLQTSYAYLDGDFENSGGAFRFREHIVTGDLLSAAYHNLRAGFGGTYMRSKRDLDVESFLVRLTGIYSFTHDYKVEVVYSAFNFDDLADPSPTYSRYYTANVVEVILAKEL